jgi:hypothetical protein
MLSAAAMVLLSEQQGEPASARFETQQQSNWYWCASRRSACMCQQHSCTGTKHHRWHVSSRQHNCSISCAKQHLPPVQAAAQPSAVMLRGSTRAAGIVLPKLCTHGATDVSVQAGFGADIGLEKFMNIKCRASGLKPDAAGEAHSGVLHAGITPVPLTCCRPAALPAAMILQSAVALCVELHACLLVLYTCAVLCCSHCGSYPCAHTLDALDLVL